MFILHIKFNKLMSAAMLDILFSFFRIKIFNEFFYHKDRTDICKAIKYDSENNNIILIKAHEIIQ